jgi:hypothetical protein
MLNLSLMLVIDATKEEGDAHVDTVVPLLAPRGVLMTSRRRLTPHQLAWFVKDLRFLSGLSRGHVPVGNGFDLIVRVKNP